MPTVDPSKFQAASAERMLSAGLRLIEARNNLSNEVRESFANEARLWSRLPQSGQSAAALSKAWLSIDESVLDFLELLVGATNERWRSWVVVADRTLVLLSKSLIRGDAMTRASFVDTERVLNVLSVASRYDLDVPGTPASWRSLSLLNRIAPKRMADLNRLVKKSRVLSAQGAKSKVSAQAEGLRSKSGWGAFGRDQYHRTSSSVARKRQPPTTGSYRSTERAARRLATQTQDELVDSFKELTLIELSEFVKKFEEVFEVTVAPAAIASASGSAVLDEADGEQTEFIVVLEAVGEKKIQVIKQVRALTNLGLGEAKSLVEGAPKALFDGVSRETAEKVKHQLEATGATVTIR